MKTTKNNKNATTSTNGTRSGKALIWVRVSTDKQEIETQRKELKKASLEDGYTEDQLQYFGAKGASAIKKNETYERELKNLENEIDNNPDVTCVYVWEVSRLIREQEDTFFKIKAKLVNKHIQFVLMEPYMRLWDERKDEVDSGAEITLSVLVTVAKQEMHLKKARFKRGRDKNREEGKFNGGAFGALYGYTVDGNGYIVPDPQESKVVVEVFELYASGKYSVKTLAKELRDRGYKFRGRKVTDNNVRNYLKNSYYIGETGENGRKYPPIITKELWEKALKVRKDKDLGIQKTKEYRHTHLGTKILKCGHCGYNYTASKDKYLCYKHTNGYRFEEGDKCKDSVSVSIEVIDGILWELGQKEEIKLLQSLNLKAVPRLEKEIEVLEKKYNTNKDRLDRINNVRLENLKELVKLGDITLDEYKADRQKLKEESFTLLQEMSKYKGKIVELKNDILRAKLNAEKGTKEFLPDFQNKTQKEKREIVVRHILKATVEKAVEGGRKCIKISVELVRGGKVNYIYYYTLKDKARQLKKV